MKKNKNIFITFLNCLEIKYSNDFANKLYNEHPYKYSLFGLSKMLDTYNIKNAGIKIENKEELQFLEAPFIAHIGSDFVVVYKIAYGKVFFIWNKKSIETTMDEFCNMWSGVILYAEPNKNSIEPNYKIHRKKEILEYSELALLTLAIFLILAGSFISNGSFKDTVFYLLAIVNLTGLYVCWLLLLKQLHIHSEYGDKICSLFKQNDCNDILELDVAKLGGFIGWSEIGFGYFFANVLIVFCFPEFIVYMSIINILALPYTFWSVWFQWFRAKQWCILCLIVQALLWIIFIIDLTFGIINLKTFNYIDAIYTCILYSIPIFLTNILIQKLSKGNKTEQITQELNSIKSDEDVFLSLLKKQPHYNVSKETSSIMWGNKDSNILITILTNPHCNPCAIMHKRIEQVLEKNPELCFQYIFSSFSEDLDGSNKFLISTYINDDREKENIFTSWFSEGKNDRENFFCLHKTETNSKFVIEEFEKHKVWKAQSGLSATPTILVNGYKLPNNYKIEDLVYM